MSAGTSVFCWIIAASLNGWLLLGLAPRLAASTLLKRAGAAFAIAPLILVAIMLCVAATGRAPSDGFGNWLFQSFFTVEILALLSIFNAIFHGMVDVIITFHQRANAANLHRFPISFLIRQERGLKLFGTLAWCAGGALMLYGVWFDMHI
jgi:hypothetical protein